MTVTQTPLDLDAKAARPKFRDEDHPRDRRGRFIETGARVKIGFGSLGTVVRNLGKGRIEVTRDSDKQNVVTRAAVLTVVEGANGKAPTDKPDEAPVMKVEPRSADAVDASGDEDRDAGPDEDPTADDDRIPTMGAANAAAAPQTVTAGPAAPSGMTDDDLRAELWGDNLTWLENSAEDRLAWEQGDNAGQPWPSEGEYRQRSERANALAEEHLRRTGQPFYDNRDGSAPSTGPLTGEPTDVTGRLVDGPRRLGPPTSLSNGEVAYYSANPTLYLTPDEGAESVDRLIAMLDERTRRARGVTLVNDADVPGADATPEQVEGALRQMTGLESRTAPGQSAADLYRKATESRAAMIAEPTVANARKFERDRDLFEQSVDQITGGSSLGHTTAQRTFVNRVVSDISYGRWPGEDWEGNDALNARIVDGIAADLRSMNDSGRTSARRDANGGLVQAALNQNTSADRRAEREQAAAPAARYSGSATHESAPLTGAATRDPMLTDPDSPEFEQRYGADAKIIEAGGKRFRLLHDSGVGGLATYVSVQQPNGKYKVVGYLQTYADGETSKTYVEGDYRRIGLGSQMRDFARERGALVRHSRTISTEGAALANSDNDDPDYLSDAARAAVVEAGLDPERTLAQRFGAGYRMWMLPESVQPGDSIPTRTSSGRVWIGAADGAEPEMREVESTDLTGSRPTARMTDGSTVSVGVKPIIMQSEFVPSAAAVEPAAAPEPDPAPAPAGPTRRTSRGRQTVVTLPDGSTASRNSARATYTHAVVVGPADPTKRIAHLEREAAKADDLARRIDAAVEGGRVTLHNRNLRLGGAMGDPDVNYRGEPYYDGFEARLKVEGERYPIEVRSNSKGEHEALGEYVDGEYVSFPRDEDGRMGRRIVPAKAAVLDTARSRAAKQRQSAAQMRATIEAIRGGDTSTLGGYEVLRWSSREDLARTAAQGEFATYAATGRPVTVMPVDVADEGTTTAPPRRGSNASRAGHMATLRAAFASEDSIDHPAGAYPADMSPEMRATRSAYLREVLAKPSTTTSSDGSLVIYNKGRGEWSVMVSGSMSDAPFGTFKNKADATKFADRLPQQDLPKSGKPNFGDARWRDRAFKDSEFGDSRAGMAWFARARADFDDETGASFEEYLPSPSEGRSAMSQYTARSWADAYAISVRDGNDRDTRDTALSAIADAQGVGTRQEPVGLLRRGDKVAIVQGQGMAIGTVSWVEPGRNPRVHFTDDGAMYNADGTSTPLTNVAVPSGATVRSTPDGRGPIERLGITSVREEGTEGTIAFEMDGRTYLLHTGDRISTMAALEPSAFGGYLGERDPGLNPKADVQLRDALRLAAAARTPDPEPDPEPGPEPIDFTAVRLSDDEQVIPALNRIDPALGQGYEEWQAAFDRARSDPSGDNIDYLDRETGNLMERLATARRRRDVRAGDDAMRSRAGFLQRFEGEISDRADREMEALVGVLAENMRTWDDEKVLDASRRANDGSAIYRAATAALAERGYKPNGVPVEGSRARLGNPVNVEDRRAVEAAGIIGQRVRWHTGNGRPAGTERGYAQSGTRSVYRVTPVDARDDMAEGILAYDYEGDPYTFDPATPDRRNYIGRTDGAFYVERFDVAKDESWVMDISPSDMSVAEIDSIASVVTQRLATLWAAERRGGDPEFDALYARARALEAERDKPERENEAASNRAPSGPGEGQGAFDFNKPAPEPTAPAPTPEPTPENAPDYSNAPAPYDLADDDLTAAAADAEAAQAQALRDAAGNRNDPAYRAHRQRMEQLMDEQFRRASMNRKRKPVTTESTRANNVQVGDRVVATNAYNGVAGVYTVDEVNEDDKGVVLTYSDELGRQWDESVPSDAYLDVVPRGVADREDVGDSEDSGGGTLSEADSDGEGATPGRATGATDTAPPFGEITANDMARGNFVALGGKVYKIVKVRRDGGDPDAIMVTTEDAAGRREEVPFGVNAAVTRVRHLADPDAPARASREQARPVDRDERTARPTLYTYQRRNIIGLGLDDDPAQPAEVRQAAARIRARQPLSAEQSAALSKALRDISNDPRTSKVKARTMARLADRLDAAEAVANGRPAPEFSNRKVTKVTPDGIAVEDRLAYSTADGTIVQGVVVSSRSMMRGRLFEVTLRDDNGLEYTILRHAGTDMYVLPDLPDPVPVVSTDPAVIAMRDVTVGDTIRWGGGEVGGPERDAKVTSVTFNSSGGYQITVEHDPNDAAARRGASRNYYGTQPVLRVAPGEHATADGARLPDLDHTPKTLPVVRRTFEGNLPKGTRITVPDGTIGRNYPGATGTVRSVRRTGVREGYRYIVEIDGDNGNRHTAVLYPDRDHTVTVLAPPSPTFEQSLNVVKITAAAKREQDQVSAAMAGAHANTMSDLFGEMEQHGFQRRVRPFRPSILPDGEMDRWVAQIRRTQHNSTVDTAALQLAESLMGGQFRARDDVPARDALAESLKPMLRQQAERTRDAIAASLEGPRLEGESDDTFMRRIHDTYLDGPSAASLSDVSETLLTAWQARPQTGDAAPEGDDVTVTPTGRLSDRLRAYRAALGTEFGQGGVTVSTFGDLSMDNLAAGKVPEIRTTVTYRRDAAADGGPGETALRHLGIVRAAGADIDVRLTAVSDRMFAERYPGLDRLPGETIQQSLTRLDAERKRLIDKAITLREEQNRTRNSIEFDRVAALRAENMAERTRLRDVEQAVKTAAATIRRDAALEVLGKIRPMAGVRLNYADGVKRRGGQSLTAPPADDLVAAMRVAEKVYPTSWMRSVQSFLQEKNADRMGAMTLIRVASGGHNDRGHEIALSNVYSASNIDGNNPIDTVAIHELGHSMEHVIPGMRAAEHAFLWDRTSRGNLTEGTRRRDTATTDHGYSGLRLQADQFKDPYAGREYPQSKAGNPNEAYEIFTVGIQGLMAGDDKIDDDYRQWLLGTLALLGDDDILDTEDDDVDPVAEPTPAPAPADPTDTTPRQVFTNRVGAWAGQNAVAPSMASAFRAEALPKIESGEWSFARAAYEFNELYGTTVPLAEIRALLAL